MSSSSHTDNKKKIFKDLTQGLEHSLTAENYIQLTLLSKIQKSF